MPRDLAILACTECKRRNYTTTRNKKTTTERLEKVKFCKFCLRITTAQISKIRLIIHFIGILGI